MKRPVYVTGIGACTAAGIGPSRLWDACVVGRAFAERRTFELPRNSAPPISIDVPFCHAPITLACDDVRDRFGKPTRRMTPASLLAVFAAQQALEDAGQAGGCERTALVWGSGSSVVAPIEAGYKAMMLEGKGRVSPLTVADSMASAPASAIAALLNIQGPSFATASACASSAHAIAIAGMLVASGVVDHALAGGSEILSDPGAVLSWHSTGVLAKGLARPFHKDSAGINLGDGAGAIFLSADPTGAKAMLGTVGFSTGAVDVMSPHADAIDACLANIMNSSRSGNEACVINCHATGTQVGDRVERECLARLSQFMGTEILCSATKGITGHTMSASGVLEAIIAIKSLEKQVVPAAFTVRNGEWCSDNAEVLSENFSRIYSTSFGFGGMNVLLSFEKF